MSRGRILLACASALLVQACAGPHRPAGLPAMAPAPTAAPAPAGPQTFRGIYRFGFEVSSFEGCSLRMSDGGGWEEFARRHPEIADTRSNGAVYEYQMAFEGSRQAGGQYGHMGRYDCEYSVTRLLDSRRIPSPPSR